MNATVHHLAKKLQTLSPEQIAEVDDFVDFLRLRSQDRALTRAGAETSASSFAAIWNNPGDGAYDAA